MPIIQATTLNIYTTNIYSVSLSELLQIEVRSEMQELRQTVNVSRHQTRIHKIINNKINVDMEEH